MYDDLFNIQINTHISFYIILINHKNLIIETTNSKKIFFSLKFSTM